MYLLYCDGVVICMLSMIAKVMSSQLLHNGFCSLIAYLTSYSCGYVVSAPCILGLLYVTTYAYSFLHLPSNLYLPILLRIST